jgi:hypothetical protein
LRDSTMQRNEKIRTKMYIKKKNIQDALTNVIYAKNLVIAETVVSKIEN